MGAYSQIYEEVGTIAATFTKLKAKFTEFHDLAVKFSDKGNRGIIFESEIQKDYFDVRFAGKCLRFLFSVFRDDNGCHGQVTIYSMNPRTLDPLDDIGEFVFETHGRTNIVLEGETEAILINTDVSAPYLIDKFLYDSFLKKM